MDETAIAGGFYGEPCELLLALAKSFLLPPPDLSSSTALATGLGRGRMSTGVDSGCPSPTQNPMGRPRYKPFGAHLPACAGGLPGDKVKWTGQIIDYFKSGKR